MVLQKKLAKDYKMSTNANFFLVYERQLLFGLRTPTSFWSTNANFFLVNKTPTGMNYFLQANLDNSVFNLDAPLKSENFYSESN